LKVSKELNGNCNVPRGCAENPQLGQVVGWWVNRQCNKKKKGTLSKEKVEPLEEVGFQWVVGNAASQLVP
jgi:hypothetical protein